MACKFLRPLLIRWGLFSGTRSKRGTKNGVDS
uniref:Uncharacterized protein n=1 Tax=Siphoviridae sp. ctjOC2 TaxID=2825632 RepID=A0A8S5Q9G1_9CAUD|nr:MAG TPA: hypothetical protein [Siphoviridae sp. ctjOC2]